MGSGSTTTPAHGRAYAPYYLLAALLGAHVIANIIWLALDHHVIRIDELFHARGAREFFRAFFMQDYATWGEWGAALLEIRSPYPPLLHVLGAGVAALFGYSQDTLSFTSTLIFVALLLGVFTLSRVWLQPWGALLATAVVSLTPALYGGSRHLAQDYLAAALVVWAIYALVRSERFTRWPWVVLFALLNGLGLLARQITPLYLIVPAAICALAGLYLAVQHLRQRQGYGTLTRVVSGCLVALLLSSAVGLPWYAYHREYLVAYWVGEHKGGSGPLQFIALNLAPADAGDIESVTEGDAEGEGATEVDTVGDAVDEGPRTAEALRETQPVPPAQAPSVVRSGSDAPDPAAPTPDAEAETPVPTELQVEGRTGPYQWGAYWAHIVNNGAFLPLTLVALAGLGAVALTPRYRTFPTLLLVAWLVGSYVVLTLMLRFATPRYALPMLPVLGILAALLILRLPGTGPRRVGAGILLGWLALTYGHLSFGPALPSARAYVPWPFQQAVQNYYRDSGLALFKEHLILGTYSYGRPHRSLNYVDRTLTTLVRTDAQRHHKTRDTLNYMAIWRQNNFGGFEFAEPEFWPGDHALQRPGLREQLAGGRPLNFLGAGPHPDEVPWLVRETDYVVIMLQQHAFTWGVLHPLHMAVREEGFRLIDYFPADERGLLPACYVGIYARLDPRPLDAVTDPIQLFDIIESADSLPPETVAAAQARLTAAMDQLPPQRRRTLNEDVDFVEHYSMRRVADRWFQAEFVLHCKQVMDQDWNMAFIGDPLPAYAAEVRGVLGPDGMAQFNFPPLVPTTAWGAGEYVRVRTSFYAADIPFSFLFGMYNEQGMHGHVAPLGWINLGDL